ncbi:WRC [Macleaya cordata]|uniref:Growth-regulating factor n=1 Tax=Macleaya cordata TaxID=56857 RepID=A0A200QBI1_MACCD|nr:WRC [Macleaya cordata]
MGRENSSPPSIGLDLGLGSGLSHGGKSCFTFLQLQELEHQSLIFKHMAAGLPVPFHLVLPIWKSLASSYGALHSGSGIYPSFLGCKGVYFDYKNSMEPEPGRCRRTDGKKWRCSKDVVPDQKYCEKHMHRGRNRSRKPVEITPQVGSSSSNNNITDSNTNLSISIPLQLMTTTSTTTNTNNSTITTNTTITNLDFSPKSVLQNGGTCKKEPSL